LRSDKFDTIALFAALSLFLSIIELLIPKPFPFFRIGLANLPLLLALTFFTPGEFILLVLLKIFGQAIVAGTLFSYVFLFSAVGSVSAGLVMLSFRRLYPRFISLVGISVAGAFGSNCAQLFFAAWMIFGRSTRLIAPPFLLAGTISGILLGSAAMFMLHNSRWLQGYSPAAVHMPASPKAEETILKRSYMKNTRGDILLLAAGLAMIPPFIFQSSIVLKAVHIVLFLIYGFVLGKRIRIIPGIIILCTVTAASLLDPLGEVFLYIGSFPLTMGAFRQGLTRGLNLIGMVYLSRCTISTRLRIPGEYGRLFYKVFFYFEELSSIRLEKGFSGGLMKNIREKLSQLDTRLMMWSSGHTENTVKPAEDAVEDAAEKNRRFICITVLIMMFLHWALFFIVKFGR